MACSCSAHEYGRGLARPVTVSFAGAVPSTIAAMMRGDTKARGASRRICRSPWPSRLAISEKEAIRPCRMSSIHARALAIAVSNNPINFKILSKCHRHIPKIYPRATQGVLCPAFSICTPREGSWAVTWLYFASIG